MKGSIDQLVKTLLHKSSIDECSLPELSDYASKYPWFGAAQLLLAKKMQSDAPEEFPAQYQKTLLYFDQPLWVDMLLNGGGSAVTVYPDDHVAPVQEPVLHTEPVLASVSVAPEPIQVHAAVNAEQAPEPVLESVPVVPETIKASAPVAIPAPEIPPALSETAPSSGTDLLFEPYHTVDYFASQGIRFREEEKPADRFGMQLKSFTEWLKTMKKVPVAEMANQANAQAEQKVEQLAGQSITSRDVVTEAMAEVWEKQGNTLKAIEIYQKLSLLEPAKSTYFAALIDRLKKNS